MDKITEKVKKEAAQYFHSDSHDYLERFKSMEENMRDIGTRSKLLIDLLFSMECSLKSLIFQQSIVDEKETYKNIKEHNLKKLLQFIRADDFIDKFSTFLDEYNLDSYRVEIRYRLEANIRFRNFGCLGEEYYDTISNYEWLQKVYDMANQLYKYTDLKAEILFVSLSEIDIQFEQEWAKTLANIKK